ncbi:MAG: HAMP domain-containing histidine kinase [Kofleriaceae bacterium]|nr:HAMP domain-containing histidine kinase [Myxococcales bacterium]MCB9559841.1 HAMP domain-containing histidine kinase [Kofleriaceae bacterium]MCB9571452.1 HAMP domain-containing histidine kinase [Kofleriaceae bacterium]
MLASAAALAYYGWSYTAEVSSRERALVEDTMRELAEEKIIGIESQLVDTDNKVFSAIHIDRPFEVDKVVKDVQAPVVSVFLLDADLKPIPSGYFSKRPAAEASAFRERFLTQILPTLPLRDLPLNQRSHVHGVWNGEEHLFSFSHRWALGRDYYVVLETDLVHVIFSVLPQFFPRTPRLYQVVDENGDGIYGTPFREPGGVVVELPFVDTVDRWRLRVAQRDTGSQTARGRRKLIDIVLIGLALTGIVAGLTVLLLASRRERKANELKSEFISNVSHELKTPLSIISMFGEMLALGRVKTPAQAHEYADIIWRESVRLARLIDNVLDFAKIERGKDVYEFAEGDVAEVVLRAVELSGHRLQQAEMTVETEIEPDLPPVSLDGNALTLATLNLVDNAIKYAADGKRIVVRLRRDGARVVLEVKDFGPGIDAAEHDRIFERFYRARAVRLKPIRGSGIGLALVEHIAKAHGGGVWIDSKPGAGATFGLWIPVPDAETS